MKSAKRFWNGKNFLACFAVLTFLGLSGSWLILPVGATEVAENDWSHR